MTTRNQNTINLRNDKPVPVCDLGIREKYSPIDYIATAIRAAELALHREGLDPYSPEYAAADYRAVAMQDQRNRIAASVFSFSNEDLFYHER